VARALTTVHLGITAKDDPGGLTAMRRLALALVLLLAVLSPVVQGVPLETGFGAPLPDDPDAAPITNGYSPVIRAAFARVSDLDRYSADELATAKSWVVVGQNAMGQPAPDLAGAWIVDVDELGGIDAAAARVASLQATGIIEVAYPLVERQMSRKMIPNDARFDDQWHLRNTGQTNGAVGEDVNITAVWNSTLGTGVVIGIVDDGLDTDHEDLSTNYRSNLDWDWCGNDGNPNPGNNDPHGTAVAGVAAGTGNNSIGVSGSAPDADLVGLRLISCGFSDSDEAGALSHNRQTIDIYSNSWGPYDDGQRVEGPGPLMLAAMEADAYQGRGGLGNIITFAAGNGLSSNDDSNTDGWANNRFTIGVSATTHNGDNSWYSEPGDNILIAAPSDGDGEGITTTDIEGGQGYSNGDYTDDFGGTSSATPLVSGIIALMLERNSNLTWRDVQHILVNTARVNDANDWSWDVNGAGHDVSHKYGFGVIDAGAAVELASNWTTVEPEQNYTSQLFSPGISIPDDTGVAINDSVYVNDEITLEMVEIYVDITHTARGDLEITLISPSGTESTLAREHNDRGNHYADWVFTSTHFWDEPARGNWTIKVEDTSSSDSGTLDSWQLMLHGIDEQRDTDGDGLLDDNETNTYGTDPDNVDTDGDSLSDGDEVLNLSTDPLDSDTDDDGLTDGVEVLVNGTDPLNNDTDGDGLLDGPEVMLHHSDPLVYDNDTDNDSWYWFNDCNDTDPLINPLAAERLNGIDDNCNDWVDEGFNASDEDWDGLVDWAEYHVHGTNLSMWDTDGDGLSDGDEVNVHGSDPLSFDKDTDGDGWYWFADCDDEDPSRNMGTEEELDGFDNDCDDLIDEDFQGMDSDNDMLFDLDEYNLIGSDPFHNDTDRDGLLDGEELLYTLTDPLWPDLDEDSDGYRWFDDCDDNDSARSPDANEIWNWIDDDCDGDVDNGIDRSAHISFLPDETAGVVTVNLTHQPFEMTVWLVNVSFGINELVNQTEIVWILKWPDSHVTEREWAVLSDGDSGDGLFDEAFGSHISAIDCSEPLAYNVLEHTLCHMHNQTVEGWGLTFQFVDGGEVVTLSTNLSFEVWNPPPPDSDSEPDEKQDADDDEADGDVTGTGIGGLSMPDEVVIGLGAVLVFMLIFMLITRGRRPPPTPMQMQRPSLIGPPPR